MTRREIFSETIKIVLTELDDCGSLYMDDCNSLKGGILNETV